MVVSWVSLLLGVLSLIYVAYGQTIFIAACCSSGPIFLFAVVNNGALIGTAVELYDTYVK